MTEALATTRARKPMTWRRDDIQGLRAIAVILVVAFHSGLPVPGGFVGVDVFFVISGFVITELILRSLISPAGFRFRTFYSRRFKRLLPALALMVSVVLILAVVLQSPFGAQQDTAATGMGAVFFVANFVIYTITGGYFDAPAESNPLLHTWSLSVEEQFYFIFPAVMVFAWWLARRLMKEHGRSIAVALLALLSVASFALCLVMSFGLWSPPYIEQGTLWAFYSSFTRAWEFAVGALLALALARWPDALPGARGQITSAAGALLLVVSAFWLTGDMVFPGVVVLVPVLGTLLVIAGGSGAGAGPTTVVSKGLALPLMVWLGALSYSWYLWHWPVIVFGRGLWPDVSNVGLIAAVVSLIPAWFAYRFVENPLRENNAIRGTRIVVLIAVAMAIPTVLALALVGGARNYWGNATITNMAEQILPLPASFERGCSSEVPLGQRTGVDCEWNADATGSTIYLVGDSEAGQLTEAVVGAGSSLGRPVVVGDMSSCAFVMTDAEQPPVTDAACQRFVRESVQWLADQEPGTVVIAMSPNYLTPESTPTFEAGLEGSISALEAAGHDVVLLQAIPQFPGWAPSSCSLVTAATNPSGCGETASRAVMDEGQQEALSMFAQVAEQTRATLLDVRSDLCTPTDCATNDGTRWIFRDSFHITVAQSELLTPVLAEALDGS